MVGRKELIASALAGVALAGCSGGKEDPQALGRRVYAENCASCHGPDLEGSLAHHAPNLKDGIWLIASDDLDLPYGQMRAADIARHVRFGIHADHPKTAELARMPALGERLTEDEISDVAEFVVSFHGAKVDPAKAERGRIVYDDEGECFDCHGWKGRGDGALGSTDFTRNLWLWGGDRATIMESVRNGRAGVSPAFEGKLSDDEIQAVAAYVYSRNPKQGPL